MTDRRREDEELRLLEQTVEQLRRALRMSRGEKTPAPEELTADNQPGEPRP